MAGFKTHITTSSLLGAAYGAGAWWVYDTPISQCVMAGGLCGLSGMLPDLDSDSGVPLRESIAFAAAVVPMFMIERFKRLGMDPESIVLSGAGVYLAIRFGLAKLLKHYTVHRGMFHSIPAALIAGELAFLICARDSLWTRYFFGLAVIVGFMSHLVLDEIWSVEFRRGRFQLKKSFGTAIKFWSDSLWANFSTYAKLGLLSLLVWQDPVWMDAHTPPSQNLRRIADDAIDEWISPGRGEDDVERDLDRNRERVPNRDEPRNFDRDERRDRRSDTPRTPAGRNARQSQSWR